MLMDKVNSLSDTPSVNAVAEAVGISAQAVRMGVRCGRFPFGLAVQVGGKKRWTYFLFKDKIVNYFKEN